MFFYLTLTKTLFLLQIYLIYVIFEKLTYNIHTICNAISKYLDDAPVCR